MDDNNTGLIDNVKEEIKNMDSSKKNYVFIARIIGWVLFALILPIVFIGWRYNLFSSGKMMISGWGVIALVIAFFFCKTFVGYIKDAFKTWSWQKQFISGIAKVIIPLVSLLLLALSLRNSLENFIQAISLVIISEFIAIPINPFPEYIEKKTNSQYKGIGETIISKIADGLKEKDKENK